MELVVRQFRWQEQFHGIPWNFECANFDDSSSSMEFHGIPWHLRQFHWHEQFHGIPWNSMELEVRQFRLHEKFYRIPWNLECANFADTSSSMEFYTILKLSALMIPMVPLNYKKGSIEFHGTDTSSSMEFHGTLSAPISLQEQFHGIPWNLEYANFNDTNSSMEFHGIPWN